jgi:hypothetical protein
MSDAEEPMGESAEPILATVASWLRDWAEDLRRAAGNLLTPAQLAWMDQEYSAESNLPAEEIENGHPFWQTMAELGIEMGTYGTWLTIRGMADQLATMADDAEARLEEFG